MQGEINWSDYFYYDETGPSCLRWKVDVCSGRYGNRKNVMAGDFINRTDKYGYYTVTVSKNTYKVHRIIYSIHKGEIPDGFVIDHIDGDNRNNKLENLRAVTTQVNARNSKKYATNSSGINGVSLQHSYKPYGTYSAYVANWVDLQGKKHGKSFSIEKYGRVEALRLASEYRNKMIEELNRSQAGYSNRHGGNT